MNIRYISFLAYVVQCYLSSFIFNTMAENDHGVHGQKRDCSFLSPLFILRHNYYPWLFPGVHAQHQDEAERPSVLHLLGADSLETV